MPQPVHHSAGALRLWVVIALTELIAFAAHITRTAHCGPTRAPWPHRAHATASRPPRGRRRGDAPSWTACPRRGRRERPDALAPDACGAPGAAGWARVLENPRTQGRMG